jgi:hypothetical protein
MKKSNRKQTSAKTKRLMTKAHRKGAAKASRGTRDNGKLNPALRKVADWMRERLVKHTGDDVVGQFEIAVKVKEVIDGEATYGSRAVAKLARDLGVDFQRLYTGARVARAWPTESAFDKVIVRKNKHGIPLSWSHLCVLAKVRDSNMREKFLDKAVTDGLSVRDLRAALPPSKGAKSKSKEPKAPMKGTVVALSRKANEHAEELTRWRESLADMPDGAPSPALKKVLEAAVEKHGALATACEETIKTIHAILNRAEHAEKKPKGTVTPIRDAA